MFVLLVAIYPRQDGIYPADGAAEPAVCADGLAAEAKDELAKGIVGGGQADVEEVDVLEASAVGIFDGVPERQLIGVNHDK